MINGTDAHNAPPAVKSRRFITIVTIGHFFNDGAANFLPGVLPLVLVAIGQPLSLAGVLMGALALGQICQPLIGWLADTRGGRAYVPLGLLMTSVGGGLVPITQNLGQLIAVLLLVSLGSALYHPPSLALVRSETVKDARNSGFYMAIFFVGGELGRGFWPTIASIVTVTLGYEYLWLIVIPGLLWLPILFRHMPVLPRKQAQQRVEHARRPLLAPVASLISFRVVLSFSTVAASAYIPALWYLNGGSTVGGAALITAMITVGAFGNIIGGSIADRFGLKNVLYSSFICIAVLSVAYTFTHGVWSFVIAAMLGMAIFFPSTTAVMIGQDIFPNSATMGTGIALGLAGGIGALCLILIGAVISDAQIVLVFYLVGILALAALVVVYFMPLSRQHDART
ncbi:MFS transporter [Microbacterium esteraromaticum]|uniref:MFS transporter n=1 Tax=Microbacterium esteraromaticum TaxID=57043 RepID=UPI001C98C4BA|nr:MFS transporter [Microbacterium esteraromaticum]MBY6062395.1 MFS transporter [Microbacterium esteraromaticum]